MAQERIYRHSASIVGREVAGEVILVPIRKSAADLESIYTLNETAGRIWELIDGQRSTGEIRDALAEDFEVARKEAEQDVEELLAQLKEIGAIERV